MKLTSLLFFIGISLCCACTNTKKDAETQDEISGVLPDSKNEVTVITLQRQAFNHELVSNGKVAAGETAELRFETAESMKHIWVKNGDRVKKGQKLAELDTYRLQNKLTQAKQTYESAKLELQDVLIGQGYVSDNLKEIPEEVMNLAKIRSGIEQSKAQYELVEYELAHATLTAPFDGVVANMFSKPHNIASTSEAFCTLINTQGMEADFTVLESELSLITNGDKVQISPYSNINKVYTGSICEINPLVDDKGMVTVKARVNGDGALFTGMNVRVSVFRALKNQLVIPKSAVVLRSGKQVVFSLKNNTAYWNYVHTGLENAEYYTLVEDTKETLKEGDEIIVSGNINLAHEAPVTVMK